MQTQTRGVRTSQAEREQAAERRADDEAQSGGAGGPQTAPRRVAHLQPHHPHPKRPRCSDPLPAACCDATPADVLAGQLVRTNHGLVRPRRSSDCPQAQTHCAPDWKAVCSARQCAAH